MQIYLNTCKKQKIINYKNNLLINQINILLLYNIKIWLPLLCLTWLGQNNGKFFFIVLLKYNLLYKTQLKGNISLFNLLLKKFKLTTLLTCKHWLSQGLTKKSIYPALKSPFIYKKAFRHFAILQNFISFNYDGNWNYLWPIINLTYLKIELVGFTVNIKLKETQFFFLQ